MTSKVQQAKDAQGYTKQSRQCKNCFYFASNCVEVANPFYKAGTSFYIVEKNKRCTIGGFAAERTASCKRHEPLKQDK